MKTKLKISLACLALIVLYAGKVTYDEAKAIASAYLFGYPLVIADETKADGVKDTPFNVLAHNQTTPDPDFRLAVAPNVDTLYSLAMLDLKEQPLVISMPDTDERYYVLPFYDAWTNCYARTGKSTTGTEAKEIAIVGPDFRGELPEGITEVFKSPTNMNWLIGRLQLNGPDDIPAVVEIQNQMALTPLSAWQLGERKQGTLSRALEMKVDVGPMHRVQAMSPQRFFTRMNELMVEQTPSPKDDKILSSFSHLAIAPGVEFKWEKLSWLQKTIMELTIGAFNKYSEPLLDYWIEHGISDGWFKTSSELAESLEHGFGEAYLTRAIVAKLGIGMLPPKEATYPSTDRMADGEKFDASLYNYRLHFPADGLPPANAFWSLTIYDAEGWLIQNNLDRYSLGDRSDLDFNEDGSLDIYVQKERNENNANNWLPAHDGEFKIVLRIYMPEATVFTGEWVPPVVEKQKRRS